MNWKKFLIVCVNLACVAFPYNIIGCAGGDADPYDYYVSFFSKNTSAAPGFQPFYFTNVQFLYSEKEPVNTATATAAEWAAYGNNAFSGKDAYAFVVEYARKDLANLYYHLEKNQPLQIPDSVSNNGMTKFFSSGKDLEALGYILYAKQVEPNVTGEWTAWEPISRDQEKMGKLMKNGQQLYAVAKNNFIKLRLAYQVARLAHYSGRYTEAIQWYDTGISDNPTQSVLKDLGLSLKAGAMMRLGQKPEAAYIFSQLFSKSELKRISNYMSFDWCVKRFDEADRKKCLALCKTDLEKANMLGLFALGSNRDELNALKRIQQLAPNSPLLEILLVREMNKLEEYYYTPALQFHTGKDRIMLNYAEITTSDSSYQAFYKETKALTAFCQEAAKQASTPNKALYSLTAAHASLITGDYPATRKLLDDTKKLKLSQPLQDQWAMTNLLWIINTMPTFDSRSEEQLFSSMRWLEKMASTDTEYAKFYRRIYSEILAPRYQQMEVAARIKYLLCIGVADWIQKTYVKDGWGYYGGALSKLRTELSGTEVEQLIQLMESKNLNAFEKYIVEHNSFSKNDVNDVAGTSFLRQFDYANAIKWFSKIPADYYKEEPYTTYLAANPFADLIIDTHAPTPQDTVRYTRLSFSRKMLQLETDLKTASDPEKKAKLYYELAKGYYQMSYYGNSWLLVQYSWSSNESVSDANPLKPGEKEYFGVYKAEDHYLKAFALTKDKNLKARCLFMAAKCDQKQVDMPLWNAKQDYKEYEKAMTAYRRKLMVSPHFTTLAREYSTTPFYKEAYNTCSYLKDFVRKIK